jgi:hypothetical protein
MYQQQQQQQQQQLQKLQDLQAVLLQTSLYICIDVGRLAAAMQAGKLQRCCYCCHCFAAAAATAVGCHLTGMRKPGQSMCWRLSCSHRCCHRYAAAAAAAAFCCRLSYDGFENKWAVNVLAPFLLTLLLPPLCCCRRLPLQAVI